MFPTKSNFSSSSAATGAKLAQNSMFTGSTVPCFFVEECGLYSLSKRPSHSSLRPVRSRF